MRDRYGAQGYPTEFKARVRCLVLFQRIEGVDTILFVMYTYEYGDDCPEPNRNRVGSTSLHS